MITPNQEGITPMEYIDVVVFNEVNKQSTRIAIAHCKRVIKEWGCAYGMVAPQYQTECASKIKYYQSILSELEGRVK